MAIHTVEFDDERTCFKCAHDFFCILSERLCTCDSMSEEFQAKARCLLGDGEAPLRGNKRVQLEIMVAHLCCKFEAKKE